MNFQDALVGTQIVRSKGDYVVGRIGEIIARDEVKKRVKVSWGSWVKVECVEPTFIPYKIVKENCKFPKYVKL